MTLLVLATVALAFVNGANDMAKGVATLVGSGAMDARRALALGTGATLAGSATAVWLGHDLMRRFGGLGVVPESIAAGTLLQGSAAAGAAVVVGAAAVSGLPVSTTHALIGGLVGAGMALAGPAAIGWSTVAFAMLAPLLGAPVVAGVAAWTASRAVPPRALETRMMARAHLASAVAISFARGLNDTPKIAGLLSIAGVLGDGGAVALIAVAMSAGAVGARRVGETMAHEITSLTARDGAIANLTASALVLGASPLGLPVSTTHVTVASLVGVGTGGGGVARALVARIGVSWLLTLPLSVGVAYAIARALTP